MRPHPPREAAPPGPPRTARRGWNELRTRSRAELSPDHSKLAKAWGGSGFTRSGTWTVLTRLCTDARAYHGKFSSHQRHPAGAPKDPSRRRDEEILRRTSARRLPGLPEEA